MSGRTQWISVAEAAGLAGAAGVPARDRRSVVAAGLEGNFKIAGGHGSPWRVQRQSFQRWLAKGGPRNRKRRAKRRDPAPPRPATSRSTRHSSRPDYVRGAS